MAIWRDIGINVTMGSLVIEYVIENVSLHRDDAFRLSMFYRSKVKKIMRNKINKKNSALSEIINNNIHIQVYKVFFKSRIKLR